MGKPKVVVIHQMEQSITNLVDTMEFFKPDYVFLISPEFFSGEKPAMALLKLKNRNVRDLGDSVKNVVYADLMSIKDAWHKTTMMQVYELIGQIKSKSEEMAGDDKCEFYVGLSEAQGLMASGAAFAAVLHNMKTYYTRGQRTYYHGEYVLQIDNLNNITSVKNWLEKHEKNKKNLRYLNRIIQLESENDGEQIVAERIHAAFEEEVSIESVRNAINRLEQYSLISASTGKPKFVNSTELGKLTIRMFYDTSL